MPSLFAKKDSPAGALTQESKDRQDKEPQAPKQGAKGAGAAPADPPKKKGPQQQGGRKKQGAPAGERGAQNQVVSEPAPYHKPSAGRSRRPAPKDGAPTLRIISLGGLNEIGKNLTVIECMDDIIVVDCGLAFPDDTMPGIDLVIPDVQYLVKNADRVRGILITHGHEDHTGALPYVLKQINVPVYCTRLTGGLIKNKLEEHRLMRTAKINRIDYGDTLSLGCFDIEVIRSNHSIPDACAFAIDTPAGCIIHTGDFKIDATPIDGEMMDLGRLGEFGRKGVLALIADSTNAEREGHTRSERIVGASLSQLFAATDKRIVVTTFASNIHRVKQIILAAERYGRKVAISGRSMVNNVQAAKELGVIQINEDVLIDIGDLNKYPPERLVIVTTGSQGEPMSALYRMAFADHRNVEIGENDLVIISASPVPGNEETVSNVVNELMRRGAEVITNKEADIHVSGHASKEEQKLIIGLTKPKFFIPMHGEYRHMKANANTAISMGIDPDNVIISDIGKVIELTPDRWRFDGKVPSGKVFIDGKGVGDVGSIVLRDRKNLAENGLIVVAATLERGTRRILAGPDIVSRGFVYVREADDLIENLRNVAKESLLRCQRDGVREWSSIKNTVKEDISSFVYKQTRRSPMVLPILVEV
ncbi:MAG: RNase J family beta-CASP ribonuclease [Clostridiales bacterium]|nr:RNase J family beta-CASP ribonuclease [Clostridiales bacterium]